MPARRADNPSARTIARREASPEVRAAVRSVLTGHMAGSLSSVDVSDRSLARTTLERAGFGETSIAAFLDDAILLAARSAAAVRVGEANV